MLTVKLLDNNKIPPEKMASHAGKICYRATIGDIETEEMLDVENQLFKPGHHTTFEHQLFNFEIDGIAVSDITFGLHLVSPFYNSDQRSGRYSKMFDKPNFDEIREYIIFFYGEKEIDEIMEYIEYGYSIFAENIDKAAEISAKLLAKERIDEKYISGAAKKIAQEQLRNFVSVSFDTGFMFSIDPIVLVSMYECPLNPVMKKVMDMMKDEVIKKFPEIAYIFREDKREYTYESVDLQKYDGILYSPVCLPLSIPKKEKITVPKIEDMIPIDKLNYKIKYMNNGLIDLSAKIETSIATMGQDQRHRTIKRSAPIFTGRFYSPAIITELDIEDKINILMAKWKGFHGKIDDNLFILIAPYGAMVEYEKKANINALAHEQLKRMCWCAQEEIYNLNRLLREYIEKETINKDLLKIFLPPCMKEGGRCFEGDRWCRRAIKDPSNPCPIRKV